MLRQFAWGVPAFVLAKVLTPPFFAREDTRRPMIFAVASVVVTVALGSALFFGLQAASASTGCWAWPSPPASRPGSMSPCWTGTLVREKAWAASGRFVSKFARVLAASAVMAAVLVPASVYYRDLSRLFLAKEIAVLVVVGVGALVYRRLPRAFPRRRASPS